MACAEAHVFLFYNFNILLYIVALMAFALYIFLYTSNSSIAAQPVSHPSIHLFQQTSSYLEQIHIMNMITDRQTLYKLSVAFYLYNIFNVLLPTQLVVINLYAGPRNFIYNFDAGRSQCKERN